MTFSLIVHKFRAGISNSDCFMSHMKTYKVTHGPHCITDATMSAPELTTKRLLHFYFLQKVL